MKFGIFMMGARAGSYQDILPQILFAEDTGFHSVFLGERHFSHGDLLYPSPFNMAAYFAGRTKSIRIGTAARILSVDHPIHVAEDAATLDILSGGRLDFGVTRASLDEECHLVFGSPMNEARSRFKEALEVIINSWTKDSFSFDGLHYKIPEVSVFPKPAQIPHPPIFVVAVSDETLNYAAEKGYSVFIGAIRSLPQLENTIKNYWHVFHESGNNGDRVEIPINRFIYVSETEEKARREIEEPFMNFMEQHAPDLKEALVNKYGGEENFSFDRFNNDFCLFGSPETVATKIKELVDIVGMSYLLCTLNFITLDHKLCFKSMKLFSEEVMSYFK